MKKIICAILMLCFILSSATIYTYGLDSIDTNVPNVAIDMQINKLLSYYYDSLIGDQPEPYSNICIENENTLFFKKFVEFDSLAKDMADCRITTYHFDYEYIDFEDNITSASASISADFYFTYEYRTTESAIGNIIYNFTFDKVNNKWYISSIDTTFDGFVRVEKVAEDNPDLTIEELFANEIQAIEENLEYEAYIADAYEAGTLSLVEEEDEMLMPLATTAYYYTAGRAAAWASAHALDGDSLSANFKYIYDPVTNKPENCQNFVSQFIWAGYGGHLANGGNIRQNILNNVRMVSGSTSVGWFGCPPDFNSISDKWCNVNDFWTFAINNAGLGPRGTGYNNGGLYTGLHAGDLTEGRILQLREGGSGSYEHSIIVSDTSDTDITATAYNKVYVCANSNERQDVPLKTMMIDKFGGSNCYMRMIVLSTGYFDS